MKGTSDIGYIGDDKGTTDSTLSPHVSTEQGRLIDSLEPHDSYEGKHRWDPTATWTPAEEAAVVRKTDFILLTWICVMFFGLQLGQYNSNRKDESDIFNIPSRPRKHTECYHGQPARRLAHEHQ